jgi:hypothetical protein
LPDGLGLVFVIFFFTEELVGFGDEQGWCEQRRIRKLGNLGKLGKLGKLRKILGSWFMF